MSRHLHKKSILKKTAQVGISSLVSKFMGIIREILQVRYLGIGAISDAFAIAYKIPNSLRKVFAEGALSAAFIPTIVKIIKDGKNNEANKLMSLLLIFVGSLVLSICLLIFLFPQKVILLFAPGFAHKELEFVTAIPLLRVLIFFILLISISSLLAGAIQAKHHFTIPAWGPVILNIAYILGLLIAKYFELPAFIFSIFILIGGLIQFFIFYIAYKKLEYQFDWPDIKTKDYFKHIMAKFLPCLFSMSAIEINLLIDARFASNLPTGSITLVNLASRFMQIVLSAFASAFSSILLSHFSRIITYAPNRLSYYLLESSKFIFWITIPVTLFMIFFSYDIFYTSFYQFSNNFSLDQVKEASILLIAFVSGLFFYSLNKLFLSIYYSMGQTFLPTVVSLIGAIINVIFNAIFINYLGALGLAIATTLSAIAQSMLFIWILYRKFNFTIYIKQFGNFLIKYFLQLSLMSLLFYMCYKFIIYFIKTFLTSFEKFLLYHIGLWLWIGPLTLIIFGLMYFLKNFFKIKLYFLE